MRNPTITVVERVALALQCTLGDLLDNRFDPQGGGDLPDSVRMVRHALSDMIIDAEGQVDPKKLKGAKARLKHLDRFIETEKPKLR